MSAKKICVVTKYFDAADLPSLCCSDKSHEHISNVELRDRRDHRLIETQETPEGPMIVWLREPKLKVKGVVRTSRQIGIRGLTAKVGETLAAAIQGREEWAQVMYANQRLQREHPSNVVNRGPYEIFAVS